MVGRIAALYDSIHVNERRIEQAASEGKRQVTLVSPRYFSSEVASHFRKRGFAVYKSKREYIARW